MKAQEIIAAVLLFTGCFFQIVAAIGIVRFPDFYARIHPAGKSDTLGQFFVLLSLIVYEGLNFISLKLLMIIIFIFIANPTATYAIAKAAWHSGLRPWQQPHSTVKEDEAQ